MSHSDTEVLRAELLNLLDKQFEVLEARKQRIHELFERLVVTLFRREEKMNDTAGTFKAAA